MAKSDDKDRVRKIWLAGIGAYGRALTEAKGAVDSLSGKSSEVFEDLVQKGEMLEAVGKYKAEELLGKGKAAAKDITPDFDIDDRITRMRERLSGGSKSDGGDSRLSARVDRLEAKLDAILEHLDIGDAAAKKPKAPSKVKIKTERTAKPKPATAKKPAAKKPVAKKPAPKKTPPKKTSTAKK